MKPVNSMTLARRGLLTLAAAALAGCAAFQPPTPEEQLRARAQARWDALKRGDFDKAYTFLSPGSRTMVSREQYRNGFGNAVAWKAVDVASVSCETSEKCIVRVRIEHEPVLLRSRLGTIESHMDETWLLDGGQWWHVYRP